jgi:hypothetical protein
LSAEEQQRRWRAAVDRIRETMNPEHARLVAGWLSKHMDGKRQGPHVDSPDHVCPRCIDRLDPPALARAVWFMLIDCLMTGAPVAMPPNVAEVYLHDSQAYPASPCDGCGYLLPTQSTIRPDGGYRHIGVYLGECPVCGANTNSDEESSG